jgi:branched-chain amino acid aminotransferase
MLQQVINSAAKEHGVMWLNGEIVPWQTATTSVMSHSLHYGTAAFEGIRVYKGKPFQVEKHMARFHSSTKLLGYEIPYSQESLVIACQQVGQELAIEHGIEHAYMRPLAWLGEGHDTRLDCEGQPVHILIAAFSMDHAEQKRIETRKQGIKLQVSKWRRIGEDMMPIASKCAGTYASLRLAKQTARKEGYDDGLMLDREGYIAEATTANFFAIMDGVLVSPTPDRSLNGLTRQLVISIAKELGVECREARLKVEDLKTAESAFLTGTAIGIMPVRAVEDMVFEAGHPSLTAIMRCYFALYHGEGV